MIVKSKVLTDFLEKTRGSGSSSIDEMKINFGETAITINAKNTEETTVAFSEMGITEFQNYKAIGDLGIDSLPTFLTILSGFDKVDLDKTNNLLTMKEGGRKIETILTNSEFIDSPTKKELVFTEIITVDAKKINKFISDAKLSKDFVLKIKTLPKQLVLETDGKYKFTEIIDAPEAQGGVEVKFAAPFVNAISVFSGNVILKLKTDHPIMIVEKTQTSSIGVITAPRI